jgi:hypothetical protein
MNDSSKTKRVKLNLDDLLVESFDTLPGALVQPKGTVRAFETDTCGLVTNPCYSGCQTVCGEATCEGATCQGPTCQGGTCYTCELACGGSQQSCQFTCTPACASVQTYASCGGSCEETDCPGQGNCTLDPVYCREV